MNIAKNFDCILIGETNLLIECGTRLLARGHKIKWVISKVAAIQSWCAENHIPYVASFAELPENADNTVDYLFSIVNGIILRKENLKLARIAAFNYHDSLLPKYAGVHATTWGLLNNEKMHGITWHMITEQIDDGDIAVQKEINIEETETALTLNLRCFDAAIEGFSEVLDKIESSSLVLKKQPLENRSYYGSYHPIPDCGFIDWDSMAASDIERMSRALDFGNYDNGVGTLKISLGDGFVIVKDIVIQDSNSNVLPHVHTHVHKGGILLSIEQNGLLISTTTLPIFIKTFVLPNGKSISVQEFVAAHTLQHGFEFPRFKDSKAHNYEKLYSKGLSNDKYWIEAISNIQDLSLFADRIPTSVKEPEHTVFNLSKSIPSTFLSNTSHSNKSQGDFSSKEILLGCILLYLFRINNYEPFTLHLIPEFDLNNPLESLENLVPPMPSLFLNALPLNLELKDNYSAQEWLECVRQGLQKFEKRRICLKDIYARYPSLASCYKEPLITISFKHDSNSLHSTHNTQNSHSTIKNIPSNSLLHFEIRC